MKKILVIGGSVIGGLGVVTGIGLLVKRALRKRAERKAAAPVAPVVEAPGA